MKTAAECDSPNLFAASLTTNECIWLRAELVEFWDKHDGEFDYVDTLRIALRGVDEQEARYEEIKSSGCCGSHDVEFGPSPEGKTYLYGFNHGH